MLYFKKAHLLFLFFSINTFVLLSQNISFSARADARQVPLGGYFEVSFILQNASLENLQLPDFRNFEKKTGPNRGSSINITNGVKTVEETLSFTLQTKTLGNFTIAPAKVTIKGKTYSTETIQVEVVKGSAIAKSNVKGAFLKLDSDVKETYIGGQIVLDLKLYANTDIRPIEFLQLPDLDNFFHKNIDNLNIPPMREVVKGVQFQTQIIKRVILYPLKEGNFTISPCSLSAMTGGMFDANMVSLQSNELIINVKKLPDNPPSLFNGAVGVLELESIISKNQATTDDALSMQVTITGKGDAKLVFAPKFKLSDSLESYEPKLVTESDVSSDENGLTFSKTFEYLIVPKFAGHYEIKPSLTYFDTESNRYETISTSAHAVDIVQGSGKKELTTNPSNTESQKSSFSISFLIKIIGLGLLMALLFFFFWQFQKRKKDKAVIKSNPISLVIEKEENKIQVTESQVVADKINYLNLASLDFQKEDWNNFYKNISKAIITQLVAALEVSENNASSEQLLTNLKNSPKVHLLEDTKMLLSICDRMRFGGGQNEVENMVVLEKAKILCKQLDL